MFVHCCVILAPDTTPNSLQMVPWPGLITTWRMGVWRTGEEDLPKIFVSPGNKRQCVTFRGDTPGHWRHCQNTAGTAGTLPARPEHCRHDRNTVGTTGTQPGLRHRVWDTIAVGKSSCSQDVVVLVEMPTGQPGRHRDNRVTVGITGSRSGKPGRRFAVGTAGSPSGQQERREAYSQDAVVLVEVPTGQPGRGRVSRVAVGMTGSRSGKPGRRFAVGTAGSPSGQQERREAYSQDAVVLVEVPTGQPGRGRVSRVAVGITGSRSGKPGRRFAVGSAGTPWSQPRCPRDRRNAADIAETQAVSDNY